MRPREIAVRAAKTALQSGLAVVLASQTGLYSGATWKAGLTATIAGLLSAAHNALSAAEDEGG